AEEHCRRENIRRDDMVAAVTGEHSREIFRTADVKNSGTRWLLQLAPHVCKLSGAPVAHRQCEPLESEDWLFPKRPQPNEHYSSPNPERAQTVYALTQAFWCFPNVRHVVYQITPDRQSSTRQLRRHEPGPRLHRPATGC